jgi:UPF0716 protein FxsA
MFVRLLLLFTVVPIVELLVLIELGRHVGLGPTLALVLATGVLGAALARWQGLATLRRVQAEMEAGRLPTGPLVDGLLILIAGAVLLTPGLLTDVLGFALLVPATRVALRRRVSRAIRTRMRHDGNVVIDAEWEREDGPRLDG